MARKMDIRIVNAISACIIILTLLLSNYAFYVEKLFRIILLLACWFSMLYFTHCLAHYVVGRLLGVEFDYYFLSRSMLFKVSPRLFSARIFLTLKLRKKPKGWRGFIMYLAGPLASMLSPLSVAFIALSYDRLSALVLFALTAFNAIFTGYFSFKYGCIRKGLNCLNV